MSCNKQCVICKDASYPLVSVTSKGLTSLIGFSAQRDYDLNNYLRRKQAESDKVAGVYVHEKCRRDYNNRKRISSLKHDSNRKNRSLKQEKLLKISRSYCIDFYVERHAHRIRNTQNELTVTLLQL